MKTGTSSLNPYAASYIPISRRGTADANKDYSLTENAYKCDDATLWSGSHSENTPQNQHQSKASQNYIAQGTLAHEEYATKGNPVHGSYGSSSQTLTKMMEIAEEEREMDLAYLQMMFPGISCESLSDVYFVNKGDLEATLDMLNHFEQDMDDYSENLLQSLDISDVSEYGSSTECASLKLKKVAGEVAGSSSGSSESAPIT
ncbi:Polyadenylate-binding protein [Actinidia chinensis var. chinensis]|uniref:Polyadenylate-binding protein n=1 Tax=Actinidia chinensis var. chinensis TaxID=1590841 RepID=A0A2R6PIV7_ACTCC|nr:Polyadenylate-binding protein [Actinidia chinensis var. chinensis]